MLMNVTVHAKTSLVRTKIEIHFLAQLIASYVMYLHSMSPMARLNWSAFLGGGDLQPCKTLTATLAPVERANWSKLWQLSIYKVIAFHKYIQVFISG